MGVCRRDLQAEQRRRDADYPDTTQGVRRLLLDYHTVREIATRQANFALIDSLVDLDAAIKNALNEEERDAVQVVYIKDRGIVEGAGVIGIDEKALEALIDVAERKLAAYLKGDDD